PSNSINPMRSPICTLKSKGNANLSLQSGNLNCGSFCMPFDSNQSRTNISPFELIQFGHLSEYNKSLGITLQVCALFKWVTLTGVLLFTYCAGASCLVG